MNEYNEINNQLHKLSNSLSNKYSDIENIEKELNTLKANYSRLSSSVKLASNQQRLTELRFEEIEINLGLIKERLFFDSKKEKIQKAMKAKYLKNDKKHKDTDNDLVPYTNSNNLINIINLCDEILNDYSETCMKTMQQIQLVVNEEIQESYYCVDIQMNNPINILNKYIIDIHQIKFECETLYAKSKNQECSMKLSDKEAKVNDIKREILQLKEKFKALESKYKKMSNK